MPRGDGEAGRKRNPKPVLLHEQFLSCLRAPGRPGLCNLVLAIHGLSYNLEICTWKNEFRSANGDNLREKGERSGQDVEASSLGAFQAQAPGARLRCNKSSEHRRFGGLDRPWMPIAAALLGSAQLQLPGPGVRASLLSARPNARPQVRPRLQASLK